MPAPYLSSEEIDGLMRVVPLYVYFPKEEWKMLREAEKLDPRGDEVFERYSKIYKEKFIKSYQEEEKELSISASGCKSNLKDEYRFRMVELTDDEIALLSI